MKCKICKTKDVLGIVARTYPNEACCKECCELGLLFFYGVKSK